MRAVKTSPRNGAPNRGKSRCQLTAVHLTAWHPGTYPFQGFSTHTIRLFL